MNAQTYTLPNSVKIETLAKWLDKSDPENPQIKFSLAIHGPHGRMVCPYSGGILAFIPHIVREKHSAWLDPSPEWALSVSEIHPLDVVHSLIRDAQAGEMSFPDFCSDSGFDEDSRKAFQAWQGCQRLGAEFRRIMGRDLFAAMEEGLQDY